MSKLHHNWSLNAVNFLIHPVSNPYLTYNKIFGLREKVMHSVMDVQFQFQTQDSNFNNPDYIDIRFKFHNNIVKNPFFEVTNNKMSFAFRPVFKVASAAILPR